MALRIEMLAVGDELLAGLVLNSNAATLAAGLAGVGLGLSRVVEVGDDRAGIAAALTEAAARADAVVVTGGLGPTCDDLTREGLADAAGVGLERDPGIEARLRDIYADHGVPIPDLAYRQADVPGGAVLVPNPTGSAPGLRLTLGRAVVYALPGVPSVLAAMLTGKVLAELGALAGDRPPPATATVRVALTGESAIAATLTGLETELAGRVRFAYLAEPGDVRVRLLGPDSGDVAAASGRAAELLGAAVYSVDPAGAGQGLAVVVHDLLAGRGATVAVAESLTGGLLAGALTEVPGASATFRGGAVVYATDTKALYGVDPVLLAQRGPVDADVARALATGVRDTFAGTYGLATTGVAGPDPVGPWPVGAVFVAIAGPAGSRAVRLELRGDRARIRRYTIVHALDVLRREILGLGPNG